MKELLETFYLFIFDIVMLMAKFSKLVFFMVFTGVTGEINRV